jgi:hypothetical protein
MMAEGATANMVGATIPSGTDAEYVVPPSEMLAVIVVLPTPATVMLPEPEMVATPLAELDQLTPLAGATVPSVLTQEAE